MDVKNSPIPEDFFWRRMHSMMGLWLVIFLIEHLLTNSQAALYIGDDGSGFVRAVNGIKNLPYLEAIEIFLLGVPFLIHMAWGIKYLRTAKPNSFPGDGRAPSLPEYPRNKAYTWQRITSWVLLIGIVAHVIQMRFVEYPASAVNNGKKHYAVRITDDAGLQTLAPRLNFEVYNKTPEVKEEARWKKPLFAKPLDKGEVIAVTKDFGTAELLIVRDTFKSPLMIFLYTLFVLAAVFHGFNGLWTFMITWGVTLTEYSQMKMRKLATLLMIAIGFLGLSAIWGTYWINLKN